MNDTDEINPQNVAEIALGTFLALVALGLAKVIMNTVLD